MNGLNGLPDFSAPNSAATVSAFAPFQTGSYAVVPQQLALATDASGNPTFTLDLVERTGDFSVAGQYAVLDLALRGDFALDDALAGARLTAPGATVTPIAISGGFARLYPTAGEVEPSSDVLAPIALGLDGVNFARWTARLSADAGELIKGAIAGGSLLLGARVEFDAVGVATRVAATVAFEPAQLVTSLVAGKAGGLISTADVVAAFTGAQETFPLKIVGGGVPAGDFAAAVAERIFGAYATLAPSPGNGDPPYVLLTNASALPTTTVQWDLSQPALGRRQWVLLLDVLTALRAFVARSGLESLVRNVSVPALAVGLFNVDVNANLPPNRIGVPAIGAIANVAANPPFRPSSISETMTFTEPDDSGSFAFRIGPLETLAYALSGFAVATAGGMVRELTMPPQPRSAAWVQLGADDFPVLFAHVTAADRLLAIAVLTATLTYVLDAEPRLLHAALNAQTTGASFAMPRAATGTELTVAATSLDGSSSLTLGPVTPGRVELDLPSFPEFGPHRISIRAALTAGDPTLVLDVIAQESEEAGALPEQLFLTADQPNGGWGYVASSPFKAGYRYRTSAVAAAPAGAWSALLSPFVPLTLAANGTMISANVNGAPPALAPVSATTS
jgi:hypothetical protein